MFTSYDPSKGERTGKIVYKENGQEEREIETPAFMAYTRSGVVPHIMQSVSDRIVHCEWSKFLGLTLPTLIEQPGAKVLQEFSGSILDFLGNRNAFSYLSLQDKGKGYRQDVYKYSEEKTVSVWTQSGRKKLTPEEYMNIVAVFQVNLFECLCDTAPAEESAKRCKKSVDRTLRFLDECLNFMGKNREQFMNCKILGVIEGGGSVKERQRSAEETSKRNVQGFVLDGFDKIKNHWKDVLKSTLDCLPTEKLKVLPGPLTPDQMLYAISQGVDVFDSSIAYELCEEGRGLCLPFDERSLPIKTNNAIYDTKLRLKGSDNVRYFIDLNDNRYKNDLTPITTGCDCYACTNHSRAYIHHLLVTKEMLAHVLLMLHNMQSLLKFFEVIRENIKTKQFDDLSERVLRFLSEPELVKPSEE